MLVTAGVALHPLWGWCVASRCSRRTGHAHVTCSTEMGPATMFIPRDPPAIDTWQYFKISRNMTVVMQPQDLSKGLYEPISLVGQLLSRCS